MDLNTNAHVANFSCGKYTVVRISLSGLRNGFIIRWGDVDTRRIADQVNIVLKTLDQSNLKITVKPEFLVYSGKNVLGVQLKTFTLDNDPTIFLTLSEKLLHELCQPEIGMSQITFGDTLYVQRLSYTE